MKVGLAVLYGVLVTLIVWNVFVQTNLNWDGLPYAGIVLSIEEHDPKILHTQVYEAVNKEVNFLNKSRKVATPDLLGPSPYREDIAGNWQHFQQQFGLYRMRVLYTGLSWIFYKLGLPVLQATRAVSCLFYLVIAIAVFVWLQKLAPGIGSMLTALIIMVQSPVLMLAQLSTPDCFSAAIVLWAIYFFLQRQAPIACCLLLMLSLLARVDNLTLMLAFLLVSLVSERSISKTNLFRLSGWAVCAIGLSVVLIYLTHSYSWATGFSHAFCANLTTPSDTKIHISFNKYLQIFRYELGCLPFTTQPFYALLGIMTIMLSRFRFGLEMLRNDPQVQVVVALLLGVAIRFLTFPIAEDRHYMGYDLAITMTFIQTALILKKNSNRATAYAS